MLRSLLGFAIVAALMAMVPTAPAQAQKEADDNAANVVVRSALDGIMEAFEHHSLVALGHSHPRAGDLLYDLIRDPRFARDVGNIVIEGSSSRYQKLVDRYLAGEDVPYTELRRVWTDGVGPAEVGGEDGGQGPLALLLAVRAANKDLPADRRIRVWLGEPPIDWATATHADFMAALSRRDAHAAQIITENILAKGKKAVVFYGELHFAYEGWLLDLVEKQYPGAFFLILTYSDLHRPAACAPMLQKAEQIWPVAGLAMPDDMGSAAPEFRACTTMDISFIKVPGLPASIKGDAVLFVPAGRRESLPSLPDVYLDTEYRRELGRRSKIGGPKVLPFPSALSYRKADYDGLELHAPGFAELIDQMFGEYDRNGDGVVTAAEYVDPVL